MPCDFKPAKKTDAELNFKKSFLFIIPINLNYCKYFHT